MSALANWISPEVLRSLGWALVHFLWQGLALAGLLAASLAISRRATTRYALSVAASPPVGPYPLTPNPWGLAVDRGTIMRQ